MSPLAGAVDPLMATAALALGVGLARPPARIRRPESTAPARLPAGRPAASGPSTVAVIAIGIAAATVVALPLGPLVAFVVWARPRVRRLHAARTARRGRDEDLPECVELLRLCVGAGHDAVASVALVAHHGAGPVAAALSAATRESAAGTALADALARALGVLGPGPAALAHQLGDHLRHGTALLPMLDQRAFELRLARRRAAEERARRVPVRVLLPLVTCILPAFALLTVVPLLAGSLGSLVA